MCVCGVSLCMCVSVRVCVRVSVWPEFVSAQLDLLDIAMTI